jgi:hypothetical protein
MSEKPFITKRTQAWRTRDLKPWFVEAIDVIEEFGCQVTHVKGDSACPGFSYTTGVTDTCGKPELITVGLSSDTAHHALNEAVSMMRSGADLSKGRHRELVGEVEVEFHHVDPKWLHHIMLRTDWFYEGADVPVLQLVYPDLDNRFAGEEGFNDYFLQPILGADTEHGTLEHDLWASHDSGSSLSRWKFSDSPHTNAYLSKTVFEKDEPITYVSHDSEDGAWQFLGEKMADGGGPVVSCLHHPIDDDRSLEELHDLPTGWYAVRDKPGHPVEALRTPTR